MAPVTQYVFAEMRRISDHFTAGSHEWLPYSVIPTFPKLICKQQFICVWERINSPPPESAGAKYGIGDYSLVRLPFWARVLL